jgi:hypothetical protein
VAFNITFVFDGLFTFVQRPNPKKGPVAMYVLMPNTSTHPRPHNGSVAIAGSLESFSGEANWLTNLKAGTKERRLTGTLPLTSTTGVPVDEKFLTTKFADDQSVADALAGRIVLPLPTQGAQMLEYVEVEWQPEGTPAPLRQHLGPMTGRLSLTYEATNSVKIGSFPDIIMDTTITVRHLPIPVSGQARHRKGDRLDHSHLHGPLFGKKDPQFYILEDRDGPIYPSPLTPKDVGMFGADPVICTTGSGCPVENPKCGEG